MIRIGEDSSPNPCHWAPPKLLHTFTRLHGVTLQPHRVLIFVFRVLILRGMSCAFLSNQPRVTNVWWVLLAALRGWDKPREQNTVSFRKRQPRVALKKWRKNFMWGSERQQRGKTPLTLEKAQVGCFVNMNLTVRLEEQPEAHTGDGLRAVASVQYVGRYFCSPCGPHWASYTIGNGIPSYVVQWLRREANHTPLPSNEDKNAWSSAYSISQVFMT